MRLLAILLFVTVGARLAGAQSPDVDSFARAALAPPDATIYLHVEDVGRARRALADRPIMHWVERLLADDDGLLHRAWYDLARRAAMTPEALARACLDRRVTMIGRGGRTLADAQWVLLTEVDTNAIDEIERSLALRMKDVRGGVIVTELPEHALLLARRDGLLVIGSRGRPALFDEVIGRLDGGGAGANLAAHPGVARGRRLGAGDAALLVRHAAPLGGWSALVTSIEGERVLLRHAGAFDSPPFSRGVTRTTCDFAPLSQLEEHTLLALQEPTDGGDGAVETFVEFSFGQPLLSPALRANLGDRRIIAVGEAEGRGLKRPVDILSTTVAVCLEMKENEDALCELDRHLLGVASHLRDLSRGSFLVEIESIGCPAGPAAHEIDISPATDWFTGGFPVMRNVHLDWTVAEGPCGAWCVIATDRDHLHDVAGSLRGPRTTAAPLTGRFDSVGTAAGARIGRHLESWAAQAHLFAGEEEAEAFRDSLEFLATFATGVERCRWKLRRPCVQTMELEVELILAPAESTGDTGQP